MMTMLVAVAALFLAVLGCALLDPWPLTTTVHDDADEEIIRTAQGIALSVF